MDWEKIIKGLYSGVDHNIPGNGGPICASYLSGWQRFLESIFALSIASYQIKWAAPKLSFPVPPPPAIDPCRSPTFERLRRWLVAFLCFVFGVEMGYKLASNTALYALNPCHVATMTQIVLLCSNQRSRFSSALFRVHLYTLSGATLAVLFPVVNTRLFPLEVFTYYVQHIGILFLPILLMATGGAFSPEALSDLSWSVFSSGVWLIYHFVPLQLLALATEVNLNNMLCPAISDPFRGRWYRVAAVLHQSLYVPLHGKLYGVVAIRLSSLIRRKLLTIGAYDQAAVGAENGSLSHAHSS